MSKMATDQQLIDEELLELDLEQRQIDIERESQQRQLDLDRRRLKLKKLRARISAAVDLTLDDNQIQVSAEAAESVQVTDPLNARDNPLPSPAPSEGVRTWTTTGRTTTGRTTTGRTTTGRTTTGRTTTESKPAEKQMLNPAREQPSLGKVNTTTSTTREHCHEDISAELLWLTSRQRRDYCSYPAVYQQPAQKLR